MSWKKIGGIDYSKSHQNVRIQNSTMSLASVINQFGETGTNTRICSNLVLDSSASFLSYKNELDTTNLALYYKFDQKIDNSGNNTYTDTRQFNSNPLYFNEVDFSDSGLLDVSINLVPEIIDVASNLTFKKYLRFHEYSKMLVSNDVLDFNNYVTDPSSNHHEDNFSFTMTCWIYYDPVTLGNENEYVSQNLLDGFLLFSIDDDDRSGATDISGNNPGFYFWAPGYQIQTPQIFYGATNNNNSNIATEALHGICNGDGAVALRLNREWNMVALTIDGKDCKVFVNGELCGDFTFPNKIPKNKITINGNRFVDSTDDSWLGETRTSSMDVSIADMKIYSSAFHPYFIKKYYEHDLPNFEQKNNFLINNNFACFGNDLVVQKELFVNSKSHFYEDVVTHGVTEMFNSLSVTGDVAIGSLNPREKLDVMGSIRASGNLYLGYEDISTNGIYFQGVHDDNVPQYTSTCLEERMLDASGNSELLLFKGDDICGNNVIGDRIRIKAPTIYFDTYDVSGATKNTEQIKVAINQLGNMGIGVLHPDEKLDISGKVRLLSETNNNMYIFNGDTCDVSNNGSGNIGFGANVFSDVSFAGISNIAIGNNSQISEELDISGNISMGNNSLKSNIDGNTNISIGNDSLRDKIGGSNNIAIGNLAGSNLIVPPNNGDGYSSSSGGGIYDTSGSLLNNYNISSQNIFIGNNTGYSYTDNNADNGNTSYTNSIAIGHGSTIAQSNSIIIGDPTNTSLKVGIQTDIPKFALDVNGSVNCTDLLVNGKRFGDNGAGSTVLNGNTIIAGDIDVEKNTFLYERFFAGTKDPATTFQNIDDTKHDYDFIVQNRNIQLKNARYFTGTNEEGNTNMNNALGKPKPLQLDSYDIEFVYNDTREFQGTINEVKPHFHIKNHDTTFDNNVTFASSAEILALADASFNENVSIEKHLTVNGDVSFNSNLDVSGSTIIHTDLTVDRYVGLGKIPDTSYTLDVSGNTNIVGSLDISGDTTITGNFYVDGSFNMNDIVYKQIVETHQIVSITEQVDINNNGGATALKVTQYGTTDASGVIAEFFDGDSLANDVSGLVFKIGELGKTELHGNMSINKTPDTAYSLDVSGVTNMIGSLGFDMSGSAPRCTIDCGETTDAILLPRGNSNTHRPLTNELGMIRYNTDLGSLETYGTNSDSSGDWIQISSGGTNASSNGTSFIAMNEETTDVGLNSNITLGTNNKSITTIDQLGNFALAEGNINTNNIKVKDYYKPEARFHIRDLTAQPELPAMRFELKNDASANTIIKSREVGTGQALDFKTNYKKDSSTYIYQQALSIQPNGHIGIGTQTPSADANLEISNTSSADLSGNCFVNIVSNEGDSSQLRLFENRDVSGAFVEYITDLSGDQMNLGMFRGGAQKNYLTLKSTGVGDDDFRIGVGTTNPERKFQINDTPSHAHSYVFDNDAALLIHHPTNIGTPPAIGGTEDIQTMMYFTRDVSNNDTNSMSLANIRLGSDNLNNSVLDFGLFDVNDINTSTAYSDSSNNYGDNVPTVLRLKSGGHVGVNIKDPATESALHVNHGHVYIGNAGQNTYGLVFNHGTSINSRIVPETDSNNSTNYLKIIMDDSSNHPICNFGSDGTVDISANTTLNGNFDVSGNIDVDGNTNLNGTLDVTGNTILHSDVDICGNVYIDDGKTIYFDLSNTRDLSGVQINKTTLTGRLDDSLFITSRGNNNHEGLIFSNTNATTTEHMRINYLGNVGIGTSTPTEKLEVNGNIHIVDDSNLYIGEGSGTLSNNLILNHTANNSSIRYGTGDLHFNDQSNSKKMTLLQNGNLGIGTDNPSKILDVSGNTLLNGTLDVSGATQLDSTLDVSGGVAIGSSYTPPTNGMIVEGNVGIGTDDPDSKLDVRGIIRASSTESTHIEINSGGTDPGNGGNKITFIDFSNENNDYDGRIMCIGGDAGSLAQGRNEYTANTHNFVGNVGIGITDPQMALDVSGSIQCTNLLKCLKINAYSGDTITFESNIDAGTTNSVTAGSFIAASDRNLKQNIVPIERALDKVCCLEGVHYEFKNAPDVKRMGLIAQDVEKIIPEVVSENNEGTKGIDYGPIVSILIESVKELKEENRKLNKKIEDMQK